MTCSAASSSSSAIEVVARLVQQVLLALVVVEEAARHELGRGDRLAGLHVHGDHGDEDAVAGELLAVAQHDVLGVADLAGRRRTSCRSAPCR